MLHRSAFVGLLTSIWLLAGGPPSEGTAPRVQTAMDGIQASNLRDDLKFIASDELMGRDSPSPGLDRAAEYIAGHFRAAGLEPGPDGSYFQNAPMLVEEANYSDFEFKLSTDHGQYTATRKNAALRVTAELNLENEPVLKLDLGDEALVRHLTADQLSDKVIIEQMDPRQQDRYRAVNRILRAAKPKLVIRVDPKRLSARGMPSRQLLDAKEADAESTSPRITLTGEDAGIFFAHLKTGAASATVTVHIAAPHRTPATLRNVIGLLRGSDPVLRDTYVLLTAHYDHLGVKPDGPGDRIYNGANDDGSGTVSVMEVARALGSLPQHPRRSIVFMAFFGEEEGLIGSEYYAHHPVWPLEKTVADLNLEQVGRTDSTEGRQLANASLTGFDYSDITSFLEQAGKQTGIKIYKDAQGSDAYFAASDNFSLAEAGVPAETLCVAFDYSDYHAVGDEWQKIDYDNMAKVDRAIALGVFLMADSEQTIRWKEANPKTAPFVKAWEKRGTQ